MVAVLAVLAAGCQFRASTDVVVERSGRGSFEVALGVDDDLARVLADAGVDLAVGLTGVRTAAPDWEVVETELDDGVEFRFRTDFSDPAGFESVAASLHGALGPGDGALYRGLELDVDESGAARFSGEVGLLLPSTVGVAGASIPFDADDLAALLAERGGRTVRAELRVTLPGEPIDHDATAIDGRTLTWRLPVGDLVEVHAVSQAPRSLSPTAMVGIVGAALVVVVGGALLVRRRSHARSEAVTGGA